MSPRGIEAMNLRQIGQAASITSLDNHDMFPTGRDLPDFARQLATKGGLNDSSVWLQAGDHSHAEPPPVLISAAPSPQETWPLNPAFAKLPHVFTVVLDGIALNMPGTTPLAWTRGLDFDRGGWSSDSPYLGEGGHVLFLDGTVRFYPHLAANGGELRRFSDGKPTASIREALPSAARLSDPSTPAPDAQIPNARWERIKAAFKTTSRFIRNAILPLWGLWMLVLFPTLTAIIHRLNDTKPRPLPRPLTWSLVGAPVVLLITSVIVQV